MRPSSVAAVQILKITSPGSDKNSFASKQAEDLLAVEEPLEIRIVYGDENRTSAKKYFGHYVYPGQ